MGPRRPPVDPDVDLSVPRQRAELRGGTASLLAVIAVGGMTGAVARHGLAVALPHPPHGFPWSTFAVNVSGCLLIGVLMVLITEAWTAPRLVRPFLGVGVLGGYTTFSTYAVEVQQAVAAGAARTGLLYLAGTLVAALAAVFLGITLARLATGVDRNRSGG
ncbi:fluoride efflux transporter CrcB [Micromonospora andamanensis]|uniref:fluoride efflux transporter CrcB n=1 Tax=Micromonospora andamanensis TaxID=1287068 RepID=UPI0019521328|nr:fluoride efflux transporter CrcB [Micromonospora andamanensis]GIJ36974.1 putative fluoride ion transporter CrcB 1 [Micromonospora andamanensis]